MRFPCLSKNRKNEHETRLNLTLIKEEAMGKYGILIVLIAAALAVFPGCGCGKNNLAENWGRSYELNKYNQNLNPEAGKNLDPVTGLNGEAAGTVMTVYKNSFTGKGTQSSTPNLGSVAGVGQAQQ
jgi:hypothetical protein